MTSSSCSRFPWVYLWVIAALLPLALLRDFTPANELRYISIAREALADGQFFAFTNHGVPYADKPPLYLWIVMAAYSLCGSHCLWLLSLFSLLPALAIAEVMQRWSGNLIQPQFRTESRLMLLTSGLFCGMMAVLRMDMLMTMFIVLALWQFFRMWQRGFTPGGQLLFGLWVFLGVFTKGPMGILIPLASTSVFIWSAARATHRKAWHAWAQTWSWRVWLLLVGLCAVWFGAVYAEGGAAYLDNLLFHQTVDRAVDAFHHKRPFWYYGRSVWYTMLPWTFLVIGTAVAALTRRARFRTDTERMFLLSGLSTFVLLSFISSKIDVYLLPAYPFLVYLAAIYASRYPTSRLAKAAVSVPAVIISVALLAMIFIARNELTAWLGCWQTYVAAGCLSVSGVTALALLWRRGNLRLGIRVVGAGMLCAVFVASTAVPRFNDRIGYRKVAETARATADSLGRDSVFALCLHRGENLDAYIGGRFRYLPDSISDSQLDRLMRQGVVIGDSKALERTGPGAVVTHTGPNHVAYRH